MKVIKILFCRLLGIVLTIVTTATAFGQKKTEVFTFLFEGKKLSGIIEYPPNSSPEAFVIVIPGSGKTDFVTGDMYGELRNFLLDAGLGVCSWDKMGCGKSEGSFDYNQTVQNSAKEAICAIKALKNRVNGSYKIGLWGISRAGWICPLIIQDHPIDFWISVSGTNEFDNFKYLLETNWHLLGYETTKRNLLIEEWEYCLKVLTKNENVDYDEFIQRTKNLFNDPLYISLGGSVPSRKEFLELQGVSEGVVVEFDEESGLQIILRELPQILGSVECPVLAVFGQNDTQVDWFLTKELYEETLGNGSKADLTISILDKCNHNMQMCDSGGVNEDLSKYKWQACSNYYTIMNTWLEKINISKN